jgi:sterol 3beta-glucosyltransferase
MKITILTYGSRGDVQPFIPLSRGLMDRGHQVILAAPACFEDLIVEHGIRFALLAGDPEDLSRRLNDSGHNFFKMIHELMNHAVEIGAQVLQQTEEACKDADLIIHTFTHAVGAHTLACEKNIPDIHIQLFPMFTPTGDYPNIVLPNFRIRFLNRLSHQVSSLITGWSSKSGFEQVRRRAGLPKRKLSWPFKDDPHRLRTPILCAWSPSILPPSSDWSKRVHVTGYYFFPIHVAYQPSIELDSFLKADKPPICVTFGSMVNRHVEKIDHIVREALEQTDNRGVILSGWGGIKNQVSSNLLYVESVPHDWLLSHCKMIIHHGGAGTTSAGLHAGIPNIVVPFTADQPFWGSRVHAAGVGPKLILVKNLSVDNLVRAIVEAESNVIRERAQIIAQEIRSEEGVVDAIKLIEAYVLQFTASDNSVVQKRV